MDSTKKQILLIHGGEVFDSYDTYIEHLKTAEFEPERGKRWRDSLQEELADNFDLIAPLMPCKQNAKYEEWKIWFEKSFPYLKDDIVLIGVSLGGMFLAKYLSENSFPKKISATYLLAPPYDNVGADYSLGDFVLPDSLERIKEQGGQIYLYHSEDDPIVPFSNIEQYAEALPGAKKVTFKDKGHFMGEEFPELIDSLKKLI